MPDQRSDTDKRLWATLGPPLYYCKECMRAVKVKAGETITIERPCGNDCSHEIIAPRKCIAAGEGGLNWKDSIKVKYWQIAAALTGRCV